MEAALLAQYTVVALAVAVSAVYLLRRQFPEGVRRLRVAIALPLVRAHRPSWLQRVGRWIAPAPRSANDACGGCDGCGPTAPPP